MGDETLMVVDNSFNKITANFQENPRVSVLCYDPQTKKFFRINGRIQTCKEGQTYDAILTANPICKGLAFYISPSTIAETLSATGVYSLYPSSRRPSPSSMYLTQTYSSTIPALA